MKAGVAGIALILLWSASARDTNSTMIEWRAKLRIAADKLDEGHPAESILLLQQMLAELPDDIPDRRRGSVHSYLALAFGQSRQWANAQTHIHLAIEELTAFDPEYREKVLHLQVDAGRVQEVQGRLLAATAQYRKAVESMDGLPLVVSLASIEALASIGQFQIGIGAIQEADDLYQKMEGLARRSVRGALAYPLAGQASTAAALGNFSQAEDLAQQAVREAGNRLPPGDAAVLLAQMILGQCFNHKNQPEQAEQAFDAARANLDSNAKITPIALALLDYGMARTRQLQKRFEESRVLYAKAIETVTQTASPLDNTVLVIKTDYAQLLREMKLRKEASRVEREIEKALAEWRALNPATHTVSLEELSR